MATPGGLFRLRPHILARLRARLPAPVQVLTAVSVERLVYGTQVAPAVYLIYGGGEVLEVRPDGRASRIRQTWHCVAVARDVSDRQSGGPAQDDAGELAEQILDYLCGWIPPGALMELRPASLPYAGQNPETTAQLVPVGIAAEIEHTAEST